MTDGYGHCILKSECTGRKQAEGKAREIDVKKGTFVFSLFWLLLCFTPKADSNFTQEKKPETLLQHEAKVFLKLVQVFVTDKDGNPVTDLKRSDFELLEDGKPRKITDFEVHAVPQPEERMEAEAGKEVIHEQIQPPRESRKYFIFLDILGNDVIGMVKAKRAALHFIDTQLEEGDEVGILSYAPMTGLTIQVNLTTEYEKIRKAIKNAKEILPDGPWLSDQIAKDQRDIERERGIEPDKSVSAGGSSPYNAIPVKGLLSFANNREDFSLDITEVARSLRYIPGYKYVVFFSGIRLGSRIKLIAPEFSTSNSPVFVVNTMRSHLPPKELKRWGEDSLKLLSEISGGKYYENVNDYVTIAQNIQNITRNYYVLGYYVDENWDGRFHTIEVKVKQEGYTVHAQGGYINPKPFVELSEEERKVHLLDLALSDNPYYEAALSFSMLALPFPRQQGSNLVLLSEINRDELSEVVGGETDVFSLIIDAEGNIEYSSRGAVDFSQIPEKVVFQYEICSLKPGEYECRVVLRNSKTGKGAVSSSVIDISNVTESGIKLSPPLLLIPEKETIYLKLSREEKERAESAAQSLNQIYPYVSTKHSPLIEMMDQGIKKLLAVLKYSVTGIDNPQVALSARIVEESSGETLALEYKLLSSRKEQGSEVLLLELLMPVLQPGRYILELAVDERITQSKAQVERVFEVR